MKGLARSVGRLAVASITVIVASISGADARELGLGSSWEVWCCGSAECYQAEHYYSGQLEHAARWLDVTNFDNMEIVVPYDLQSGNSECTAPPGSNPDSTGTAVALIHDDLLDAVGEARSGCTSAIKAGYSPLSSNLYLRSTTYLEAQGLDWDDPADRAAARGIYAPTHELFHAVQNAYHPKSEQTQQWNRERKWIWEGTAVAVQVAYSDLFMAPLAPPVRPPRQYDVPLHEPVDDPDPCRPGARTDSYGTGLFFYSIGQKLSSPSGIAYIGDIMRQDVENERGLEAVDTVLTNLNQPRGGLFDLLPWYFSTLDFDRNFFGPPEFLNAPLPSGRSREKHEFPGSARKVAGRAHNVEVSHSSDKPVEVEIGFKEDADELHLLVDGYRYDAGPGPRNLYRDLLVHENRKDYDIVVASVDRSAIESEDRDYELEVNLREVDYCTMTARVSGDIGGSYFGDIAHFSTTGGATIYGAMSNPEAIDGVAEWLGGLGEVVGSEGLEQQAEEMKRQWEASAGELPRETFGLSLTSQNLEANKEESMAFIAGGFALEASSIGPDVGEGVTGTIPLWMLRVVPGPRADSTLDKVPFVWVEGEPGRAQLQLTRNDGHLVAGRISGTLYAEGFRKADGSRPMIEVQASFVALEGPYGCSPVGGLF